MVTLFNISQEPEFVKKSCNNLWEFSADRYEITRGHVMATITNKGEVLHIGIIITSVCVCVQLC